MDFKDDIVAISTPNGMGAISLIRVSGENALKKVEPFFKSKKGTNLSKIKSHFPKWKITIPLDEIINQIIFSWNKK